MPKAIPDCPPVPEFRRLTKESRDYQIQLITPLFGGGVVGGEPDSLFPIRGTSIRGQLQFWWRATRGAVCTDCNGLFARHQEVWGTTDRASPVEIEVIWQGVPPTSMPCAKYAWDQRKRKGQGGWRLDWNDSLPGSALPYALFPFQGKEPNGNQHQAQPEKDPAHFIMNGQFILRVRFPEWLRQDTETAVWAWVNYGGRWLESTIRVSSIHTGDRGQSPFGGWSLQAASTFSKSWTAILRVWRIAGCIP